MLAGVERDFEIVITERAGQAMEVTRDLDISRWVWCLIFWCLVSTVLAL